MKCINQIRAIIIKDIRNELRSKEILSSMLIFAFLTLVILGMAFNVKQELIEAVAAGLIWIVFLFAGVLGLNKSFATEKTNDCIYGLSLAARNAPVVFIGKFVSNFIFLTTVQALVVPLFFILFDIQLPQAINMLIIILVLGIVGFTAVGTFVAALITHAKNSEILMPIVLFPLLVPLFLGLVQATKAIFTGLPFSEWQLWLNIIFVFDLMYLTLPVLLFDYLLEV